MLTFRIARPADAHRLLKIYRYYIKKTAVTCEIRVPTIAEFQGRISNTLKKFPYLVAVRDEQIIGYAYVSPFSERPAYRFNVETYIYLAKSARGQHIGSKLYQLLEKICQAIGVVNMMACIAYPHEKEDRYLTLASPKFHQHLGYHLVGRFDRCIYKFNKWYDMIWMQKQINSHDLKIDQIRQFDEIQDQFNL